MNCHVFWDRDTRYLVTMSTGGYEMMVDLEAYKCACIKWELSGIPCYHACACIQWSKKKFEDFIHPSYTKDIFLECYKHIVEPICGEEEWVETGLPNPLSLEKKVQPGRYKKQRNKNNDVTDNETHLKRQNAKIKYSYCIEWRHNTRTCPVRVNFILVTFL